MPPAIKTARILILSACFGSIFTCATSPAQADERVRGSITAGVAMVPDFEGSEDYEISPVVKAKASYGAYYIETAGLGLRANLSSYSPVEFGPVISFRSERDDVDNARIDSLRKIDTAVEGGGFLKYNFTQVFDPTDQLSLNVQVLTDLGNTHDGTTVNFGPSYSYAPSERFRLGTGVSATYASAGYTETYFGIDANNAASSGLAQYNAGSGMKDIGISFNATYILNDNWNVTGFAGYTQLIGDAADSPIVKDEGNTGQGLIGTAVSYRF